MEVRTLYSMVYWFCLSHFSKIGLITCLIPTKSSADFSSITGSSLCGSLHNYQKFDNLLKFTSKHKLCMN